MNRATHVAFVVLAAAALFYLVTEHRAHLFGALPFLVLLACPLMHLFMHGRHGHHHSTGGPDGSGQSPPGGTASHDPAAREEKTT